jgi:nucleolar pre-ribosomal-associated protein 1
VRLLKQYCDLQSPAEDNGVAFADLISSWSYAGESKNDSVLSAVPAVLAQFLRFISSYLEFREFGLALCRSLLQKEQVRLFDRAFSTSKSKEYLISPCLRLLTEVVTFDGGAVAAQLYTRKDALLKRLDLFLEQTATKDDITNGRAPTLRRIAQRYVIANLKFQSTSIKGDLVGQGKILHALLKGIAKDGDDIAVDILQILQSSILSDQSLHRKSRLLNIANLQSLLSLYDYEEFPPTDQESDNDYIPGTLKQKVRSKVHTFYLAAIQPGNGITLPQNGWYPQGMDPDFFDIGAPDAGIIDLGLDSPLYFDEYRDKIPVKNGTLSTFIQSLKPDVDDLQASLLLNIFEIAPELVADYFSKTKRFVSKPKDDPEWRAQSAFLFSVVQLSPPKHCGWHDGLPEVPPPVSIVIESLLPRAFPQADLTRCMNLAHDIITLFAAKYMTASLQKLSSVLQMFHAASSNNHTWEEASKRLVDTFISRSASVKDIIAALQRSSKDDIHVRAALIECLKDYFQSLPQNALSEKFDVAANILDTIQKLESSKMNDEDKELLLEQLRDLCIIAERSTEVRWWRNPDSAKVSPFVVLLQAATNLDTGIKVRNPILRLLRSVMKVQGVIDDDETAFDALMASLSSSKKWSPDQHTHAFLDNCMSRIVRQPIKYLELLETAQAYNSDKAPLSLLACCVAEQWQFIAKVDDKEVQKSVASWIARLFDALGVSGGNVKVLTSLTEDMIRDSPEKPKSMLQKAIEKQQKKPIKVVALEEEANIANGKRIPVDEGHEQPTELDLNATFGTLASPPTSLEGLTKWSPSSLETDIQSGRLSRLIKCTTSPLEEVRIQTFTTLQSLLSTTQQSTHPDAKRLHLLLGELIETTKLCTLSQPLPALVSSMTTLLLRVLTDPTDKMYSKANRFLLRSPRWDISKLPSYWITQILLREAEDDDGSKLEIDRLLVMLIDGLTTEADMELYRKNAVFERCLSLWSSPYVVDGARRRICHLVWRAWQTGQAGRMTLLTRCGIGSWVESGLQSRRSEEERRILEVMGTEIAKLEEGDEGRKWKEGKGMNGKTGNLGGEDVVMAGA